MIPHDGDCLLVYGDLFFLLSFIELVEWILELWVCVFLYEILCGGFWVCEDDMSKGI